MSTEAPFAQQILAAGCITICLFLLASVLKGSGNRIHAERLILALENKLLDRDVIAAVSRHAENQACSKLAQCKDHLAAGEFSEAIACANSGLEHLAGPVTSPLQASLSDWETTGDISYAD